MTFEAYNDDFIYGSDSLWRDYLIPPVMVSHLFISVFPSESNWTEVKIKFNAEKVKMKFNVGNFYSEVRFNFYGKID